MTTQTAEEAIALLKRTRDGEIKQARDIADELISVNKSTTVSEVHAEMARRGLIDPAIPNFWLGAVFRTPKYQFTGEFKSGIPGYGNNHTPHAVKGWKWKN